MSDTTVIAIEQRLADRARLSRPALAEDMLELASGLAELVHVVRALGLRVQQLEDQWPEFVTRRMSSGDAGSASDP